MKLNYVNETCHVNDIRPCGLEMEKFDMEKSFHMGEMDDNNMVVSMKLNKHNETRCSSEIEY
jgi:hypothetical protein